MDIIPRARDEAAVDSSGLVAWLTNNPAHGLAMLCAALVLVQLLWGLANMGSNLLFVRVGLQALLKLRTELYAYLQSLSLKYHDAQRSSDSSFRVAYDSQAIQTIYNQGFTNIFTSVVTLIGTFIVMVQIDWQLTLLSLGVVPLIVGAIYHFAQRIRRQSTLIHERDSALLAHAQEGLSSIRMVHAFGREEWEVRQFEGQAAQSLRANLQLTFTNVNSALVITTLMALGTAAMYYIGTRHVLDGTLTLGSLLVFSAYLLMLTSPSSRSPTPPGRWKAPQPERSAALRCSTATTMWSMHLMRWRSVKREAHWPSKAWTSATHLSSRSCAGLTWRSPRTRSLASSAAPAREKAHC
jgi:ABC-type multidrug transport system fused ATPase/permease subunit